MENWNITAEVMRREYGFSIRDEIRARDSNPFHKSILGSYYLQIVAKRFIGEKYTNPKSLDFNAKGNLLCVGYDDKKIAIYDWSYNKLKFCFNSGYTMGVADVKLTNNDNSSLSVISSSNDGQIRHTHIHPTGAVVSTCLYHNPKGIPKLAAVPRSPYEFVAVTTDGMILQLDLRCDPKVLPTIQHIPNIYPHCVAHHPFAAEFCVGSSDAVLRIFDKRNMNATLRKMYPADIWNDSVAQIFQCTYNYDGKEILANYTNKGAHLFDYQSYATGEYARRFCRSLGYINEVNFFGPKSEFVICASLHGVYICDKNTKKVIKSPEIMDELIDKDSNDVTGVLSHPFLPVIASTTNRKGVILWDK